uniref:Protein RER1 n=1 Tax=Callithrix jacchus TaxID=9483 RepID=A0A8I4A1S2_CALJA
LSYSMKGGENGNPGIQVYSFYREISYSYKTWSSKIMHRSPRWEDPLRLIFVFLVETYPDNTWVMVSQNLGDRHPKLYTPGTCPARDPDMFHPPPGPTLPSSRSWDGRPLLGRLSGQPWWHKPSEAIMVGLSASFFNSFLKIIFWPKIKMGVCAWFQLTLKTEKKHMVNPYRHIPRTHG